MYKVTKSSLSLLFAIASFFFCSSAMAQTATGAYAGGDITYQYISGDTIQVNLDYYVQCGGSTPTTNPFLILRNCSGSVISNEDMGTPTITNISDVCSSVTTNCTSGSVSGRRRYRYSIQLDVSSDLGSNCNFYRLSISPPTRNTSANLNLASATNQRLWLQADLYLGNDATNNSPVFNSVGIPYAMASSSVVFNPLVIDVDGDSLVYSLVSAQSGITSAVNIPYSSGSGAAPISGITIDSETGILSFTSPASAGNYQVVIQVAEFDRTTGNQLSRTYRDMQFVVLSGTANAGPTAAANLTNLTNATLNSSYEVTLDSGVNGCFSLAFTGATGETVTINSSIVTAVLSGASVTNTAASNVTTSQICWTPGAGSVGRHVISLSARDNGCSANGYGAQKIIVNVLSPNQPLSTTATITNPTCNGTNDGTITVNVTGGTGPFSHTIFPPGTNQSSNVFTGLGANTYLIITIDSGASIEDTLFNVGVTNPSPFFLTGFSGNTAPTCETSCNGTATATTAGGAAGTKTFAWSTGGTGATQTNLCGGTYSVTVTDPNGCTVTGRLTQVRPPVVYADTDSTVVVTCNGGNDGEAYLSGHGGFAASTSTTSYIIDQSEGSFSPYGTSMSGTSNISAYQTFNLGDDATTSAVNIGFTFQFFGNNQTQFVISSNGNIQFGASGSNSFNNVAIPNSAVPNNWVGIWDDLNPGASTTEVIETYLITNTAGRRARVVNFVNVPHFNNGSASGLFNFQIVLYETSNVIEIHSTNVPTVTTESSNAGRTMGIENSGGTAATAVPGRNSANWGATNDYVAFIPSAQTFTYTWSSLGTGASATNLTAGNYTVTVSTSSCSDVVNFTITEPTPIVIDTVNTNPSCGGQADGQIAASASGGNGGAFTFLWNTGASTATITALAAGTYTVTATDVSGCTESLSITLVDPTPVTATLTPTNVNCLGGADGSISAVGSGGTGAITFAWSNGGTGSPVTGLTAGTYTVTATDANGCTGTATTTLTEPATAVAAAIASSTNESCSGAADGSITASGSGGTGAITFAWSNGGSGTTINGLTAATYTVTATDANGCTDTAQVTIISSGSTVVATATATTQVLCFGGNTGVAGASATGGAGTVTFAWNTGGSGTSISGLTAGTYTVTATDANGCTGSATVAITQPASGVSVTATPTAAACNGGATGSVTASGSGGTGAITFAWNTGGTGTTISSLTAGTYTVTGTDASGCTSTATAIVTQPTAVTVSVTPTQPSCSGGTGSATASGAGGTGAITFAWSTGGTGTTISSLAAGTYTVTATDASGCTATATTTINAATAVTVSITSPTNVACFGGSTGSATAVGAGGSGTFTYAWSNGATGATASALTAGTYTVTATDGNSCTGTTTVAITQPASAVSVTVTTTNALCFGGSTGTATASGSGGTGAITFAWSTGGTGTTISSLAAATYTVTATDASGCTATATGVVTAPASGVSVTTTATGATCNGGATGSATASGSGGTGAITFAWNTGGTGTTISSLTAATYTVTATDANGCTATATAVVTQPTAVSVSVTPTQPSCSGGTGSATASGAGGTGAITFAWSTGGTGTTISSLAAGTYTVTATDASGCTATATTTINAATAVTVSITSPTNVACFGGSTGSATAVGAGGSGTFTYAWSNGATGATASALTAGTYTVTATDGNTCTGTTTVSITQPTSAVSVSVTTTNALCFGGSTGTATASGSGGTGAITFAWSNSGTGTTISSLAAGTYTVTATDANGCTATATGVVAAPAQLFAFTSVVTQPTCPTSTDGTIQAFGFQGTSPYTYLWNTGGTSATLSSISAGTYTVTVTDFNGCADTEDEVLSAPNPIVLTITPTNPTCSNGTGSATVSSSGGSGTVTFAWSTGGTGATISSLTAGTYTVTATDANSCTMTGTTTITAPTAITATIAGTNVACFGGSTGSATASASGGTGTITFAWNTGATGATISSLTAGTYTVTATDASACTSTATVAITQPASGLTVSATSTGVACFGGTTGTATATSAGGSGTVTFAWNTGGTGASITSLTAGTYTITATDGGSCTATSSTTITEPAAAVSVSIASTNVVCFGASTGSATATGVGGTGTITFAWNTGGTGATISSLTAATYTVTATDASGCTATATTTITQPATGLSVTTAGTNVSCNGGNTGSATATGTGGTGTVTFAWNTGGTGATISTLTAGTYTVTATDGSSCTATATVVIAQPASAVSVSIAATNATCSTLGSATATGTGGTGTITFAWNTGSTSATISSLTAATYTVTATDASGCTATASTTITSSGGGLTVSVAGTNVLCNGATTGTATATPTGGTGTITYAWSNSATGATITTLAAGTYTVTATDGGGCTATGSVTITQPASAVTASIGSTTNPSCFGGNNGQIAASGSGGTGTLTLSWSNGATGSPNTSLTAGTYTVTVTDANGCTATASATLSNGVSISISMSTTSSLCFICSGSATAAIGATTSPYTYTWSNGNVVNTSSLSNQQTNLCSGPYSVTVTNANGCTATAAATVNDIFAPALSATAQDVSCFGACDGEVYAAYNCATCDPLEWFSFPDTAASSLLGTGDTLTGICADTVLARLTTAFGCQRFDTVIVSEPTQVLVTASSTGTGCTSSGGTATASGSGGTGSITFAWNTGGSGATITNLTAGTYTVTATDASGCTDTASVVVNSTSTLAASIASSTNVLCNAGATGAATATSTGGTGTVTFAWSTGGSGVTISTLTAGTYTVTATDAATCTATATVTLTEPAAIVPTITGTNVGCASATSGSAVANPTGGTSPYTFVWSTGSTSGTASSLTAGTYTVTVTDNNSCTATESVTLTGPGSFTVATTPTNVLCFGGTTGQALATPSGGVSPFTYLWSNGQTAQTATALTAGTYTVTATDNGTCTATATVVLTQPASAVVATIGSTTNNSCFGGAAGSTSVTGAGGTGTITFLWTTGSTAASITGLTAGSYTVTATDANGCTSTVSATITQPASGLTASISAFTNVACNAGTTGSATAATAGASGTPTFAWSNGGTGVTISSLTAGTYTVTATDGGGCTATASVTLTEPAALLANTSGTNPGCAGSSTGSATATPTGGTGTITFLWNTTATTQTITGLAVGTYTVTVTDANSCTATGTVSIINPVPMNVSVAGTNVQCNAAATGQAIATVTGGTSPFTYLWNNGQTTDTASSLTAGTYTVTVTDNGACTETGSVTITQPATAVSVTFSGIADPSCDDACDGTATASATGGTGTLTFLWSTGSSATSVTSLCGGSHTVSVTDANGCEVSAMIALVEPPSIWAVLDSSNDVLCAGDTNGEAFLSAFGGFAGSTSTAAYIVDQTEGEFEPYGYGQPANAVSYQTVTLADDATSAAINIFDGTANFSFFGNNFPQFVICSQGFITFNTALANQNAAGLYSNSATMPTAAQPNNFVAAFWEDLDPSVGNAVIETYLIGTAPNRVRVVNYINIDHFFNGTVGSGDTSTFQIVLYESSNIIQIHSEQLDPDAGNGGLHVQGIENAAGSAFYAVSGRNNVSFSATNDYVAFIPTTQNFTYTWSSIGSGSSATNLTGGNYIVTVSDGSCEDTISFVIDEPAPLAAAFSALQPSSCSSCTGQATATISGGTAGYSLTWPNSQTSTSATLLCSGINEITVTDANFCIDSFSVVIVSDSADTVIATGTNPLCAASCDGTVTATTSSTGSTFVWINQATSSTVGTSATVTGLCAGTYIVQMTNTGGCVSSDTVTIVDPTGVTASIPSSTNVSCLGGNTGAATASAVGGTSPYVFTWPGAFTGTTITGLTAGTYTVTATDNNGCTSTASVTITEPATGLSVTAALVSNVSCFGDNDGSASATAAGGTGTITFTWNGTLNGTPITGLTAGTYTVVASDASSCTATSSVTITEPADLVLSLTTSTDPSCPTILDGSATVAAAGGTSPYTFSWPSGGTGTTETGLGDGVYCVTVTDFNLCTDILCVTITDPSSVTNTFSGIANSSCTVCDGNATANPTGGNGGTYTFLWSNGQTTAANDSLCAGFNNVTITDNGGCESVHTVGIGANGADTVFAGGVDANCGACDGIVFATYNCNNGPCTVEWTVFGSSTVLGTTDTLTALCAETYAVELTNNAGCISTDTFTVNAPLPIDPNAVVNDATCGGALDGSILLTPSGGSGTYNYVWSNAAGNVANNTGLGAGTYTVTISDGSGCDTIASFVINDPSGITIATTITNASCFSFNDGSILATPSGGAGTYSFNWSPIPGNGQGVQLATGLTAGTYFLTVTDIDGCTAFDTSIVTEPTEIVQDSVNLSNATCGVCDGEIEVFISGGAGGYNYAWTNGDNTSIADSLCFGGYVLDVTDATGCSVQFNYPISETNGPTISITGTNTSANGECDGSALATVINSQGTVTFTWSNGDTGTLADSLCAGTYFVTATDVNGCNTVDTVIITEPGLLVLTISSTAITCEGGGCDGTATVAVSGGVSPYTFLWSSGGTAQTDTALCAGTYTVTVTDLNGITASASVTLDSPSPFTITSTVVNESCPGVCDGSISLNIIGGSAGATSILWSTGDTTSAITGLCPGSYYVIVSDTGGCEDSLNFNIIGVSAITATVDNIIEPDCQVSNGVIDVSAVGGNGGPYSFLWLDVTLDTLLPVQTTDSAINLFAGIYSVAITDINGCADTIPFVLNNNNAASIALDSIKNVSCFGECDGAVFVSLSGGTTPYTILWSSGGTAEDDTALCAGADTIAVVDSLFCLSFEIYQITEPAELKLDQMLSTALTCGDNCDGMLEPTISGGTEPYTFLWSNGSTDTALVDLCAGIYGLTVTDANGCSFSTNAVVAGPTAIVITLDSANDATCSYTGDGNVFITVSGGTPGYTYAWGNGTDVLSGQDLTNALAGTYRLTLTDANGCVALDTFTVATGFAVEVTAMADFDVCPDSRDIPITGTNVGGTTARWLTEAGVVINNSSNALVDVLNGERIFILEGINGICVSRDTLTIVTTDGPGIDAGANQAIEPGDEVTIGGAPTANAGVEVIWTPSTDLSANDVFNPIANPLQTIMYYVSATDENGCFGMDSVLVTVEKLVDPVDGFSPNGDGTNDFFYIGKIERYPNAIVTIFNRWGNEIYQAGPNYNNNPWNGKFKGNELPVGSYYYVIDLKDAVAKEPISGSVVILK